RIVQPGDIGSVCPMSSLGRGAIMVILPFSFWVWRMMTHRPFDRPALRIGCWVLSIVSTAGFASCFPHNGAWPLPTGLGGVVGDALVRAPAIAFGAPGFIYHAVLGALLLVATLATLIFASGWGSTESESEPLDELV